MCRLLKQFKLTKNKRVKNETMFSQGQLCEYAGPRFQNLETLHHLFETAPVGLFVLDRKFQFLYINRCMAQVNSALEFACFEKTNPKSTQTCSKDLKKACERVFEKGESITEVELKGFVPGLPDIPKYWLITCAPVKEEGGRVIQAIGSATEITERKKVEAGLEKELENKDEFLSIVSHELKTPLTSLDLRIQLLQRALQKEKYLSPEFVSEKIRKIAKSNQALIKWVEVLLDLRRIQDGKLTLEKEEMNFNEKVNEIVSSLTEDAERAGSNMTIRELGKEPIVGCWDPMRIGQIISNLVCNAIKYGEGKPIEITVSSDDKRRMVRLSVRDYGDGISPDRQTEIFQRFTRVNNVSRISGLGLGLYIVKQIVDAHEGSIQVESAPGKGALFTCELPVYCRDS